MNTSIRSVLFFLVVCIGTNSCSIEKRIYQSGYNTAWFKTKTDKSKRVDAAQDARNKEVKSTFNKTPINSAPEIAPQHEKPNSAFTTASLDKCIFSNPHRIEKSFAIDRAEYNDVLTNLSKKTSIQDSRFQLKDPQKPKTAYNQHKKDQEVLRKVGWFLLPIGNDPCMGGCDLLGTVGWLIGDALVSAARKAEKSSKAESSPSDHQAQYIDVVYLKDGSIIQGIIMRQVPNVLVKIRARSGIISVYKMEEVSKITKEIAK